MFAKKAIWKPKDRNGPFIVRKDTKLVIPSLRPASTGKASGGIGVVPPGTPAPTWR
jgi:hypothetical protein